MPVRVESRPARDAGDANESHASSAPHVTIGLVNNMPLAAFRATERQFIALLDSASQNLSVSLLLYTLPGVSGAAVPEHAGARYASVESLWNGDGHSPKPELDGLIVTGAEPIHPDLREEPYWSSFARLVDWARVHTYSTVWSCLAAHAAVLHMDGICRRRRTAKLSGIYTCGLVGQHTLMAGSASSFPVPHSRWNGLAETDLDAHGYTVLARTSDAEVDTFVKDPVGPGAPGREAQQSLFLFFQGHPEYDSDTLLREYRRDAGRFLRHETESYPLLPHAYFDRDREPALDALRDAALAARGQQAAEQETLHALGAALEPAEVTNTWRGPAANLYRNWLTYLGLRKGEQPSDRKDAPLSQSEGEQPSERGAKRPQARQPDARRDAVTPVAG